MSKIGNLMIRHLNERPIREATVFKLTNGRWTPLTPCPDCVTCNHTVDWFKDQLSCKEYVISGMCQSCQDSVFEGGDE